MFWALLPLAAIAALFIAERLWWRKLRSKREERVLPEEREKQFDEQGRAKSQEIKELYKRALSKEHPRNEPPQHH